MASKLDRNKIVALLNLLYSKCNERRPFKMETVIKFVGVSSTFATIARKSGVIERGKKIGDAGFIWHWKVGPVIDSLVDDLIQGFKTYNEEFKNGNERSSVAEVMQKVAVAHQTLFMLPGIQESVKNGQTSVIKHNASLSQSKEPNWVLVLAEMNLMLADIKDKVDVMYSQLIGQPEIVEEIG